MLVENEVGGIMEDMWSVAEGTRPLGQESQPSPACVVGSGHDLCLLAFGLLHQSKDNTEPLAGRWSGANARKNESDL